MGKFLKKEILLGIGIGLIISAIFVSVFGPKPLTDQDIRDRAAKLGMVDKPAVAQAKSEKTSTGQETIGQKVYSNTENVNIKPASPAAQPVSQQAVKSTSGPVTIRVSSGMGSERIAAMLETKGAVKDQQAFLRVVSEHRAHTRFQNGTFNIPAGADMEEIVRIMTGR